MDKVIIKHKVKFNNIYNRNTMRSYLELLKIQVDVLFTQNEHNKLISLNESNPNSPAPRFFFSRSDRGNIWRFREDLPLKIIYKLDDLASLEPVVKDLTTPLTYRAEYLEILDTYDKITTIYEGPAFYLPIKEWDPKSTVITKENMDSLAFHFQYTMDSYESLQPITAMILNEQAISVCFSARKTQFAAEAGVHTVEEFRGKGYAVSNVKSWSHELNKIGLLSLYSTTWDNHASRQVAAKLRAVMYGSNFSIT